MLKKMNCRKVCKECPWENENQHNLKFKGYVDKMNSLERKDGHKCHVISKDIWGYKSDINERNVCMGYKKRKNI
jgi:hypothetical protein